MKRMQSKKGVSALLVVMVIGAVALLLSFTASLIGILSSQSSFISTQASQSFFTAEGCVEETFRRISLDNSHGIGAGQMNLSMGNGSCIIEVTDMGGNNRQIDVRGTINATHSLIRATVTLNGRQVQLNSWEEL